MIRIILTLSLMLLAATTSGQESQSAPAVASEGQEALQRQLEYEIMAPCCYTSPVGDHDSQAAKQVKAQIAQLLAEGRTKVEILDLFVAEYGERILARPRAQGFNLLAYIMPPLILLAGGLLLIYFISRIKGQPAPQGAPTTRKSYDDKFLEKINKEMQELDI